LLAQRKAEESMSGTDDRVEISGGAGPGGEEVFTEPGLEEGERPRRDSGRSYRPRDRERTSGREERGGRSGPGGRFRRPRRKICAFCVDKITRIDYKDHQRLREYVSDRGKILKSRMTGNCMRHQRKLAAAVKRARQVALLPFVTE